MMKPFLSAVLFAIIAASSAASAAGLRVDAAPGALAETAAKDGPQEITKDLKPFTNAAKVPVDVNLSSIRFESAKAVRVATKRTFVANPSYCQELAEPGGSILCSSAQDGSLLPAYEVTYSFQGQPMPSDDTAGTYFTFSVYFRPEELSPALREAISARKIKRSEAERFFALRAQRGYTEVSLVDEAHSSFCEQTNLDGSWTRADSQCQEKLVYKTATVPGRYMTVKVEPLPQDAAVAKR